MPWWTLGGFVPGSWLLWVLVRWSNSLYFVLELDDQEIGRHLRCEAWGPVWGWDNGRRAGGICWLGLDADLLYTALPAVLAHSEIIRIPAMIMSITGGLLIYGTIISFGMFFQEEQEF